MSVPGMPESIPFAQVQAAVRTLGIQPDNVVSVLLGTSEVRVTIFKLDPAGFRYYVEGTEDVATEDVVIPIRGGGR